MGPHFKGPFWQINLGHLLTVITLLASVSAMYFKLDQRMTAVELVASNNRTAIETMDTRGTRASQQGIYAESEVSKINEQRIARLEAIVTDLAPKVDRIDTNLSWIIKRLDKQ